jgi:hypothetical protein
MEREMMELNEKIFKTMKKSIVGFVVALSTVADSQTAVDSLFSDQRGLTSRAQSVMMQRLQPS